MKSIRNNALSISILLSGIIISISILYAFNIDIAQKIFSIIGSLSISVALATYFYKRDQDKNIAAIEQIRFFREEIIPEWANVINKIQEKNPEYKFSRIKIDEPTIEYMREKYSINFDSQTAIFVNKEFMDDLKGGPWDSNILDSQINLLNMLEEFSLRVHHFKTDKHEALISIHHAFTEMIEKNAAALMFIRYVIVGNPIYSETLSLYNDWKEKVKKNIVARQLYKHKFITKEQEKKISQEYKKSLSESEERA